MGEVPVNVPRDRNGKIESDLVPKYSRTVNGFDEKVIAMYSLELSDKDIQVNYLIQLLMAMVLLFVIVLFFQHIETFMPNDEGKVISQTNTLISKKKIIPLIILKMLRFVENRQKEKKNYFKLLLSLLFLTKTCKKLLMILVP